MPQNPPHPPKPPPIADASIAPPPSVIATTASPFAGLTVNEPPVNGPTVLRVEDHESADQRSLAVRLYHRCAGDLLSMLASTVLHTIVLLVLAYMVFGVKVETPRELVIAPLDDAERIDLRESTTRIPDVSMNSEQPVAIEALPSEVRYWTRKRSRFVSAR